MILLEMFDEDLPGYRTEEDDNTTLRLSDIRKTKLTLGQLNRLRIMNDVRKLEKEQKMSMRPYLIMPYIGAILLVFSTIMTLSFTSTSLSFG